MKDHGHSVFTTARSNEKITPDLILDSTDFEAVNKAFEKAQEQLGSIDGVVNFSGSLLLKPAHSTTQAEYHDVINASLTTAFATVLATRKSAGV